mmetsp:Transcript_161528/g.513349  ORF Transcript_161528/g.513349 Transcript_161528/m.513349 type:complete len:161 (+) Transcript_161528:516-998(+)
MSMSKAENGSADRSASSRQGSCQTSTKLFRKEPLFRPEGAFAKERCMSICGLEGALVCAAAPFEGCRAAFGGAHAIFEGCRGGAEGSGSFAEAAAAGATATGAMATVATADFIRSSSELMSSAGGFGGASGGNGFGRAGDVSGPSEKNVWAEEDSELMLS